VQGRIGLRTEIIVNIVLLMGAALLFTGFILVKLAERELLAQRIASVTGIMEILARASLLDPSADNDAALLAGVSPLMQGLPPGSSVSGWGVVGRELQLLAEHGSSSGFRLEQKALTQVRRTSEPELRLNYPAAWPLFGTTPVSDVVVTVPVLRQGMFQGALQARFPLSDVRQRVLSAQKWMLLYTLLYGAVLVLFGVYFLSRTVVRPIRRLQTMSQRIAAGDLQQAMPVEGPREIADLAVSFNGMAVALRQSHQEREAHIRTLQQTNEELRQTQDELIRSEKMASVGHLAAGMAHEIGNPLAAIVGYLEFLKGETLPPGEKEIIGRALAETGRIDRLVRELLDYAAPAGSEPRSFDPLTALIEALEILRHQRAFEGLQIDSRLPSGLPATSMAQHRLVPGWCRFSSTSCSMRGMLLLPAARSALLPARPTDSSGCRWPMPVPVFRRRPLRTYSIPSTQPKLRARGGASAWRSASGLSAKPAGGSKSVRSPGKGVNSSSG